MSPLVLFILTLGWLLGYGLARIQLRGRFILAQEAIHNANQERTHYEWKQQTADQMLADAAAELERTLIKTRRCPDGYSAKQIIGHNYFGTVHPPQFEGGLKAWDATHGIHGREE